MGVIRPTTYEPRKEKFGGKTVVVENHTRRGESVGCEREKLTNSSGEAGQAY